MGGGGGTSGQIGFPQYMETTHEDWIGSSAFASPTIEDVMATALGANGDPYMDFSYDDPGVDIAEIDNEVTGVTQKATSLDSEDFYRSIVDTAVAKVDENGVLESMNTDAIVTAISSETDTVLQDAIDFAMQSIDQETIDDLVEAFARRSTAEKSKALRQFSSQMADINAVQSSAFLFGTALIEAEHLRNVNEFNKELTKQAYDQSKQFVSEYLNMYKARLEQEIRVELNNKSARDQVLARSIQMTMAQFGKEFSMHKAAVDQLIESKRINFVMDQEYTSASADLEAKSAQWDFKVYEYGISFLGGLGGGTRLPEAPSKVSSALGGAMGGASAGMAFGPVGAGIGGLLGAGAGLLQ